VAAGPSQGGGAFGVAAMAAGGGEGGAADESGFHRSFASPRQGEW